MGMDYGIQRLASPSLAPWALSAGGWAGLIFCQAGLRGPAGRMRVDDEVGQPPFEGAASNAPESFEALFTTRREEVARVCRRLLGPGGSHEDACHEVFLRARAAFGDYDGGRPFRPWLLAIARHFCIDQLRRSSTEGRLFQAGDLAPGDRADPGPPPLRKLIGAEARAGVLDALEGLPEKYRLPLVLRYYGDLDYAEIAETVGATPAQVGTLLFRAKQQLRRQLTGAGR